MSLDVLPAVRTEYQRYRRLVELAVAQVPDQDLDRRLDPDGNSIAITIAHLVGNLTSRFTDFLTSDGEKEWRRRDAEFEAPGLDRDALLAAWREAWSIVDTALAAVDDAGPEALLRTITIRRQPLSVLDALLRSLAHVAYHTGQIVLLARTFAGAGWQSPSIPRGGSAAYDADPTRERGPG